MARVQESSTMYWPLNPFESEPAQRMESADYTVPPSMLSALGFEEGGAREALREEVYLEFSRVAGGLEQEMTEERFIAIAAQLFALDRSAARACFHACDLNYSLRLDKDQYLMFREAFIHEDSEYSENEVILSLRLRAVFHKYVITRPAQRHVKDTALTRSEALMWVRDLCAGETHVQQVGDQLLPELKAHSPKRNLLKRMTMTRSQMLEQDPEDREMMKTKSHKCTVDEEEITIGDFISVLTEGNFQQTLEAHHLSWHDILDSIKSPSACPGQPVHAFSRAVFDGRVETAILECDMDAQGVKRCRGVSSSHVPCDAVNEDMHLDPHVRAVGGWRGPMAPSRQSEVFHLARRVIEAAQRLARDEVREQDCLDKNWMTEGEVLKEMLGESEYEQASALRALATGCRKQLEAQPPLVRVAVPAKVFGDIHGQFRDLLMLFQQFGFPYHCGGDIQTTSYVFNGDFVDRGEHQLEVVALLFALKAIYPAHVFLVRGNHEFRDMSEMPAGNAFQRHVRWRLPTQWFAVYEAVHQTFDWLPFAARVGGKVLVLHGGLGDGSWGLQDLEQVQRPMKDVQHSFLLDVVWSDPSDSDDVMWKGVHENPDRGDDKVHLFGPDITEDFCKREDINIVIRSHQYVPQGYKVMHGGHMITLFSARNYVGEDDNDGALLLLAPDRNGHLRVHPKSLLAAPMPEEEDLLAELAAAEEGVLSKLARESRTALASMYAGCGECLYFLQTGRKRKPARTSPKLPGARW